MKKLLTIIIYAIGLMTLSSCEKWLDINDNPNSANSAVPTADLRLPPILAQFVDGYESGGTRVALLVGQLASTGSSGNNYNFNRWYSTAASAGWPYQAWYVNTAVNIQPMIEAAEEVGAYHYVGVGKLMYAWGFGFMADLYGMIPMEEFNVSTIMNPKFDDAEYIYGEIFRLLDEAIVDLNKSQEASAVSLSKGDVLYNGDVQKWLKLAYGLQARFKNHLSKKSGFDPDAILSLLAKGPLTNDESAIYRYEDEAVSNQSATHSLQYQNNSATRVSKLYVDYLTNNYTGAPSGSNNVEDPRFSVSIPFLIDELGDVISPTEGVDLTNITDAGILSDDERYLPLRPSSSSTGTWYTAKGSPGLLLTNAEMKFIEAEIRFNKGEKGLALEAYKQGIKAHIEILGLDASAYMASSSVVQSANDLTLSHIMIQKFIALSYSPELFADVRRMDYCTDASGVYNESTGIYKGLTRPGHVYTEAFPREDVWPRRLAVPSYPINYNLEQVLQANPNATSLSYLSEPVWWDRP